MDTVIEVIAVVKNYHLGRTIVEALKGITFEIRKGEFLCIAGASGSGKTTLLNLIGCLDKPTSGEVILEGKNVSNLNRFDLSMLRRHKMGFIFQTFNLIPVLSAYENVEYPLLLKKVDKKTREEKIWKALDEVGIKEYAHHRPDELSGGQRQRVAIARALVTEPVIVLADEPTANLDSVTGENIIDLMLKINKENGTTFIFSTHDSNIIKHAGRVIELRDGVIV
jgi:putative ABC transport system ATP-binding protein